MLGGSTRCRTETGQVLVIFALALPVLLGLSALVVDVGNFFVEKRSLQRAADAAALAAVQQPSQAGTLSLQYSVANAGPSGLHPCPLTEAELSGEGGCYTYPYGTTPPDRVEVILVKTVSTLFGGILGKSSVTIRARAVALKDYGTITTPGSTITTPDSTITTPGSTIVNTITTATPGNPALMFAKSTACFAIDLQGANSQFQGAVVSNGGIDAHSSGIGGDTLIWGTTVASGCLDVNNPLWDSITRQAPSGYPAPPPVCTPGCTPTNAAAQVQITSVGGVPCTPAPAVNWTINSAPAAGLYCARGSIDVRTDITNVGLVAPTIDIRGVAVSGTSLLPAYGGLALYAYAGTPGPNEVDRVTTRGSGGTFTLTFGGQTTGALAYAASASVVQTALEGLSTIGSGNVSVVRTTGSGGRVFYDITFIGSLARTDLGDMAANGAGLTGASASASVATTTQGAPDSETSSTVVNSSGSGMSFKGAIYAPFGHVDLTGSGSQADCPDPTAAGCGFIEAYTVRLAGANASWQGLGPGFGGGSTTTTTTTTTPGSTTTNPGSTTTNPGSTTTNPGSTTTNPDVVSTVGTRSNLDE